MNLTALTTALHRWADKHGGNFPDAMLCNEDQMRAWAAEADDRFGLVIDWGIGKDSPTYLKGVLVLHILSEDDPRILFACEPAE